MMTFWSLVKFGGNVWENLATLSKTHMAEVNKSMVKHPSQGSKARTLG